MAQTYDSGCNVEMCCMLTILIGSNLAWFHAHMYSRMMKPNKYLSTIECQYLPPTTTIVSVTTSTVSPTASTTSLTITTISPTASTIPPSTTTTSSTTLHL
jgi:hypothetical protein